MFISKAASVAILLLLCLLEPNAGRAAASATGRKIQESVIVDGVHRTFRVHVPDGSDPSQPMPVVLAFHGAGGDGSVMEYMTGFNRLADTHQFAVVYPDGIDRRWHYGPGAVDDLAFVAAVLDNVADELPIDRARVYATGMSDGGFFSVYLGCSGSVPIAAIAPVAASLTGALRAYCSRGPLIPVQMIAGTADQIVPWEGGALRPGPLAQPLLSVPATMAFWVAHLGLSADPATDEWLPDADPSDGTRVRRTTYGAEQLVLYTVENGGHNWPGGARFASDSAIGVASRDFEASESIWGFFAAQRANLESGTG